MKTSEILDKAADVIERNGWYQGGFVQVERGRAPAESPCCVMGAINIAEGDDPLSSIISAAMEALAEHLGVDLDAWDPDCEDYPLGQWNDKVAESAGEAIGALRAAAASEREDGR